MMIIAKKKKKKYFMNIKTEPPNFYQCRHFIEFNH